MRKPGSDDDEVLITEIATGREVARLGGHTGNIFAVAFSDVYVRLCAQGVWHDWRII